MSETFCGSLLVLLVALVGGLNAALLKQMADMRRALGTRESDHRQS